MSDPQDQVLVNYPENGQTTSITQDEAVYRIDSLARQDPERALHRFYELCSDNPNAQKLRWKFYDTLMNLFMFEQLLEATNESLSVVSNCPIALIWKVEALQQMFRHDEAIQQMEKMVAGNPGDFQTLSSLGTYHKQAGNYDKAVWCFNRAIEQNHYFTAPYWLRSDISDAPLENLQALQALIASNSCPDDQQHFLHFAAYRFAERLERHDEAFQHLQLGNSYKRRSFNYQVNDDLQANEDVKNLFDATFVSKFKSSRESDLQPIFIMGLPRSGTTLVEQIIASHSLVGGGDEYTGLANAVRKAQLLSKSAGSTSDWLATRQQADWDWIGAAYERNMRFVRGQNKYFTDKNLLNYSSVGIIQAALPKAKIIVVDRNPMDVCFGMYRQLFEGVEVKFGYQFDEMIKMVKSYQDLMAHWQSLGDDIILRVQYEDLVANQIEQTNRILDFCGLQPEDGCYNFHQSTRAVKTLSATQVRQPLFSHGVDRYKTYENQLQPLRSMLHDAGLS